MKPGATYGPFPYSPIHRRPRLEWPGGARVAFWVIPNIEFFSLSESIPAGAGRSAVKPPDVPAWAARDYGNRVGVFRLMKVLDRYGVRGTAALNSDLCARKRRARGRSAGWARGSRKPGTRSNFSPPRAASTSATG